MKRHISYPKIQQFRNIVTAINREVSFIGLDKNGEAIYDHSAKKPVTNVYWNCEVTWYKCKRLF